MPWDLLGGIFSGITSLFDGLINRNMQRETNALNYKMMKETNAANAANVAAQNAAAQNAAAARETDKARMYNSATSQAARLRAAGMSKAGALNALTGAGAYTPAPINAAQAQAPQLDLSGVANAFMEMAQVSMQNKQLKQQKYEFDKQLDLEREKFNEEQINNKVVRELQGAQIKKVAADTGLTYAQIENVFADTNLTYAQLQTELAKYDLTMAQVADTQEATRLKTEEILHIQASTKLTYQQIESSIADIALKNSQKNINDEQLKILSKQYERLAQEVSEFMDPQSKHYRNVGRLHDAEIKEFARNLAGETADKATAERQIAEMEVAFAQFEHEMSGNPAGKFCRMWEVCYYKTCSC